MNVRPFLAGAGAGCLATLLACWALWRPEPVQEGQALEKRLPGGGLVLARDPEAKPPADVARAAREAGGKLERAVSVTVRPKPAEPPAAATPAPVPDPWAPGAPPAQTCSCAPVTIDLGLVRMPDRSRRVVATSPDGEVLTGLDIPLDPVSKRETARWAAGATYEPGRREFGAFLDRDLGPLRLGVELQQRREGAAVVLRAGIRF